MINEDFVEAVLATIEPNDRAYEYFYKPDDPKKTYLKLSNGYFGIRQFDVMVQFDRVSVKFYSSRGEAVLSMTTKDWIALIFRLLSGILRHRDYLKPRT